MNIFPLFFIGVKMFSFMNARYLAYFLQNFAAMLQARKKNPSRRQVILVDKGAFLCVFYFCADILFLFYCLWLMSNDATWAPGCMLLLISALESYAMYGRIDGSYIADPLGFVYPKMWFRYLMHGQSLFILLKLANG